MPKTAAEVSKTYRERKKASADGQKWLKGEADRVKTYYVPAALLSEKKLQERREKTRLRKARSRARKKEQEQEQEHEKEQLEEPTQSAHDVQGAATPLRVKLPFDRTRKRTSRAVSRGNRVIHKLTADKVKLQRRAWCLEKRFQRLQAKVKLMRQNTQDPKERAKRDLQKAGLEPARHPTLLMKLSAHHALLLQMRSRNVRKMTKTKKSSERVISGRITRKYRVIRYFGMETKTNRNHMYKGGSSLRGKKRRQPTLRKNLVRAVHQFYNQDDVSRLLPGKRDCTKLGNDRKQNRILADYQVNNWKKFIQEQPQNKISLSLFCKLRPRHIRLTSFTSRQLCLCIYHQNVVLKLKAARISNSPDYLVMEKKDEEILQACSLGEDVTFFSWQKVKINDDKYKVKCVEKTLPKKEFLKGLSSDLQQFRQHIFRMHSQYKSVKVLKESLPASEIVVHMDFSENYTCREADEIQSAYWSQSQITLHPVVYYYKDAPSAPLKHVSQVYISNVLRHNATTVLAIMKEVNYFIDKMPTAYSKIHYITDGPTSQYRNKYIMHIVGNHAEFLGRDATWTYMEVGHGKGPCDGVGGTTKRMIDLAVKQGKTAVNRAEDMVSWFSKDVTSTMMIPALLSEGQVERAGVLMDGIKKNVKSIKGTLALHAVISPQPGQIAVRETSCFCEKCREGSLCHGWQVFPIYQEAPCHPDDWVAAHYDGDVYMGKVLSVNTKEKECKIDFVYHMHGKRCIFKFLQTKDILWLPYSEVLMKVPSPQPIPKKKGLLAMAPVIVDNAMYMLQKLLEKRREDV